MNWIGFCKVESPTVETVDFVFRYVAVCFGTWNLTLLCDSWYVIRAASLILNVAFSRKWPLPDHQHFDFLDMKEDLESNIHLGGYPTYLENFLKNEHGHIWDVPNSPPGQWKTFAVQSGDKPTEELRVRCPGVFFSWFVKRVQKKGTEATEISCFLLCKFLLQSISQNWVTCKVEQKQNRRFLGILRRFIKLLEIDIQFGPLWFSLVCLYDPTVATPSTPRTDPTDGPCRGAEAEVLRLSRLALGAHDAAPVVSGCDGQSNVGSWGLEASLTRIWSWQDRQKPCQKKGKGGRSPAKKKGRLTKEVGKRGKRDNGKKWCFFSFWWNLEQCILREVTSKSESTPEV